MERIVTSNMGSDTITILEPAKGRGSEWTATHVAVGKGPEGLDLSPDGKELWAATGKGPDGMAWTSRGG